MNADYTAADLRRILRVSEAGLRSCLRAALLPVSHQAPWPVLLSTSRPPPHGPRPQGGGSLCATDPHRPVVPAATAW